MKAGTKGRVAVSKGLAGACESSLPGIMDAARSPEGMRRRRPRCPGLGRGSGGGGLRPPAREDRLMAQVALEIVEALEVGR